MNKWLGIGRLTKDPDIRRTTGEKPMVIARYTLAVDRKIKKDGEQSADFISCVAFGKNGEFVEKYLRKGVKIAVEGRIQTGSYEKDGSKVYTTDVVVESHEFCESKKDSCTNDLAPAAPNYGGYVPPPVMPTPSEFAMLDDDDLSLPF